MTEELIADGGDEAKPDRVFTQEQLEGIINDRMKRAEKSILAKAEAQLLVDETFRDRALSSWDVKPAGDDTKLDDAKVQELYAAWEGKHVVPLQAELGSTKETVGHLRSKQLEAEILASAAPWAEEALLKMQAKGHSALFNMVGSEFEMDPESHEWRVIGANGEYRPSPDGQSLYMSVPEYLNDWRADPVNAPFVRDMMQGGADFDGASKEGGRKVYTQSEHSKLVADENYYAVHRDELSAAVREGRVRK